MVIIRNAAIVYYSLKYSGMCYTVGFVLPSVRVLPWRTDVGCYLLGPGLSSMSLRSHDCREEPGRVFVRTVPVMTITCCRGLRTPSRTISGSWIGEVGHQGPLSLVVLYIDNILSSITSSDRGAVRPSELGTYEYNELNEYCYVSLYHIPHEQQSLGLVS